MKRIISYGKYSKVICKQCECQYTFDKMDVFIIDNKNIVPCPLCGYKNEVEVKDIK